jgi:hypothetical protein
MLRKFKVLKEYKKAEIFAIFIAWIYLFLSITVVIAASIAYVAIMLEYLKCEKGSFGIENVE